MAQKSLNHESRDEQQIKTVGLDDAQPDARNSRIADSQDAASQDADLPVTGTNATNRDTARFGYPRESTSHSNANPSSTSPSSTESKNHEPRKQMSFARGLLKTARPKQWIKNILVFAAPAAAGVVFEPHSIRAGLLAFVAFVFASVGTYFINDAADRQADREHPTKRFRPIAAGVIPIGFAWAFAIACIAIGIGLAFAFSGAQLALLIAGYVTLTCSYSLYLKHIAVVDLACVAAGFVLRMVAGGIATDTILSSWFTTVAVFSSLLVVTGKRFAEINEMGENNTSSRAVLAHYTPNYLRMVVGIALAVATAAYCQWAFGHTDANSSLLWFQLSAVPWTLSLLRFALLLEKGHGGAPEDLLMGDRTMQILGVIWLITFGLAIYG